MQGQSQVLDESGGQSLTPQFVFILPGHLRIRSEQRDPFPTGNQTGTVILDIKAQILQTPFGFSRCDMPVLVVTPAAWFEVFEGYLDISHGSEKEFPVGWKEICRLPANR